MFKRNSVEEEQGVESLVLGGSRDTSQSHLSQKGLDFGFGGEEGFGSRLLKKACIMTDAGRNGFFGAESGVLKSASFPCNKRIAC
jgi:hypothetical protein